MSKPAYLSQQTKELLVQMIKKLDAELETLNFYSNEHFVLGKEFIINRINEFDWK